MLTVRKGHGEHLTTKIALLKVKIALIQFKIALIQVRKGSSLIKNFNPKMTRGLSAQGAGIFHTR